MRKAALYETLLCTVEDCKRPYASKGYCAMHAERVRRYGAPVLVGRGTRPTPAPLDRFMAMVKVNDDTGCWEWQGSLIRGYGYFRASDERKGPAHRRGWELLRGPLASDMVLDHLCHSRDDTCQGGESCRHRRCVNPDHLEPVPHQTNVDRGVRARMTKCARGHDYNDVNTRVDARGRRFCRPCAALLAREYRRQRQEQR